MVEVLLPLPFGHGFDYRVPAGMQVEPGDYVWVPFGRREALGVVWGPGAGDISPEKIKSVLRVAAHVPPMRAAMRKFIDWVSWYNMAPRGNVLKMAIPIADALKAPKEEALYVLGSNIVTSFCGLTAESSPAEQLDAAIKSQNDGVNKTHATIKITPARQRIIAYLSDNTPRSISDITTHAGVSAPVVREFLKAGGLAESGSWIVNREKITKHIPPATIHDPRLMTPYSLSPEQQNAADLLSENAANGFQVTVLDGVTGSGKTEVYFDTIARLLSSDAGGALATTPAPAEGERSGGNSLTPQILVLLPEISLSIQWLSRFKARFGFEPVMWHSEVSQAKKRDAWQKLATGEARIVVGARSALFLPFQNLSLIVVDEEHDASYKQEEGVIYQGRDMAVARAREEKIPIVLVSATPSLETTVNMQQFRYKPVHLGARYAEAAMPTLEAVDMRSEKMPSSQFLSTRLRSAMAQTIVDGGQVMLFLNRRGYAPLLLCRTCGHRFQCPECQAWLVLHKKKFQVSGSRFQEGESAETSNLKPQTSLLCHHCGHRAPVPPDCPACHAKDSFHACGPGVERLAEELKTFMPDARVGVLTSESAAIVKNGSISGGALATTPRSEGERSGGDPSPPDSISAIIRAMESHQLDILIGTQMIAKGHHFGKLALVGVVDADMGLTGGDLRASERTYQLLHQLSGRAGREKHKGHVILQSYMPEHPVMQALLGGDRDLFMELEKHMREDAAMPPFGRLASLVIEGRDEGRVMAFCRELARCTPGREQALGIRHSGLGSNKAISTSPTPNPQSPMPLILGPAPAPLARLRGKSRWRFLVKAPRGFNLQEYMHNWLNSVEIPPSLRIKVDVDPYSFL